jgi:branched-chain amino acid transport system substrate-binding protein
MISRGAAAISIVAGVALVAGCRAILGSLDDCSVDTDCAAHGPTAMCQNNLCVNDQRCSTLGVTGADAVVVGLVLPLTSDGTTPDPNGPHWRDAVKLVVDEINPPVQQGIAGRPLQVVVCDDLDDPDQASALAQRLVGEGLQAIISGGSSDTLNIAAVTVPANVLLVSGYSQSPEVASLTANSPSGARLIWRTIEPDQYLSAVLIQKLSPEGGTPPRVSVLARNDSYGQGFYGLFQPAYTGEQRTFFFDPSGDTDSTGLAAAAAYAAPATIMWAFPADIDRILNEIAQNPAYASLNQTSWFFNDQMLVPGTLSALSNPAQYNGSVCVAAAPEDLSSPAFAWLQQEFEQTYGSDPGQLPNVASYSDAIMLIAVAAGVNVLKGDPVDGPHLAQVLTDVSADAGPLIALDPPQFTAATTTLAAGTAINIQGASGPLDFNPQTGDAPSFTDVETIVDGGFNLIDTIPP